MRLNKRVEALEMRDTSATLGKPFFWFPGTSLADALAAADLTIDDKPLFAIRFNMVERGPDGKPRDIPDPLYERDKHLVD